MQLKGSWKRHLDAHAADQRHLIVLGQSQCNNAHVVSGFVSIAVYGLAEDQIRDIRGSCLLRSVFGDRFQIERR
jgi:hypothetical protein